MSKRPGFFPAVVIALLVSVSCMAQSPTQASSTSTEKATNIILMVGDGMGPSVVGLMRDYARVIEGRELWIAQTLSEGELALVNVAPKGGLVTDSAASATALATGEKVPNWIISVDSKGKPLTTILELAKNDGKSVGLVSTTGITHATPACFAAHVGHRDLESEIAEQMLAANADVLMGGGLRYWIPQGADCSDFAGFEGGSRRGDEKNLLEEARKGGYRIITEKNELKSAREEKKVLGLFAASHVPYALDRRPNDNSDAPSLAEMTEAALALLSKSEKGFFLMVEGGRIDHAAHNNDVAAMLADAMDFDDAVGVAYHYAKKQPETAIFITADHSTGAPCLSIRYSDELGRSVVPDDSMLKAIAKQDASFVNILGPLMAAPLPDTLKELVSKHTGVEITDEDAELVLRMQPLSPFHVIKPRYRNMGGYATHALGRVLSEEYGTTWGTGEHFATPVLLIGYGPGADHVHGYIENPDIFHIMREAGGL